MTRYRMPLTALLCALLLALPLAAVDAPAVPVVVITPGADGDLGAVHGRRLAAAVRMIAPIGMQHPAAAALTPARRAAMLAAVPERLRREMDRLAAAAEVDPEAIVRGNLLADSLCSALVAAPAEGRPLRVARNMDYSPAALLGPATVIQILRPAGRHALAAVGWPGMVAVVSGINDRGLSVCLLQHHGAGDADGMPAAFAARVVLEDAAGVDEALRILERTRIATAHWLLLADATAAVAVARDGGTLRRIALAGPHLAIDNAGPGGDRAGALAAACADGIPADDGWLRGVLRRAPIPGINAQAMVFIPARRELQLAVAAGTTAAVDAAWWRYDLAPALAQTAATAAAVRLGPAR